MESFPSLHGTLKHVSRNELSLSFVSLEGMKSSAVAVQGVCYVEGRRSDVLNFDFATGHKVVFSAVRDPTSAMPEIWKTVVLWTTYKPPGCFKISDWATKVSKLYDSATRIKNILQGNVDNRGKDPKVERGIIISLRKQIRSDMESQIHHSVDDTNLDDLLGNSKEKANYVNVFYGSVNQFILHHSVAFSVSANGRIYTGKRSRKIEHYLDTVLPQKLIDETLTEHYLPVEACPKPKVASIETLALNHFWTCLRDYQQSGMVFCLSSRELEKLLERSPALINVYLTETYGSLTRFLEFHRGAFLIGTCRTVYSNNESQRDACLAKVNEITSDNDLDEKLLTMFAHRAAARLAITRSDCGANNETFSYGCSPDVDEEVYISADDDDDEEEPHEFYVVTHENKSREGTYVEGKTFEDAATQTFITGPIENVHQSDESHCLT